MPRFTDRVIRVPINSHTLSKLPLDFGLKPSNAAPPFPSDFLLPLLSLFPILSVLKMYKAIFEFSQIHQLKLALNVFR
jgi:hypothetical protein